MVIRTEQMQAFEGAVQRQFEDEMMAHSKEFTPRLCAVLGDEQLRIALHSAIERAAGYGFTNRGPVRLFIELMFLCGSGFDNDPQYPAIGRVLRLREDQMQRAMQIHQGVNDYSDKVAGPENANVRRALRELAAFARAPLPVSSNHFEEGMLQEMNRMFPQKTAYVGDSSLKALIEEGRTEALKFDFSAVRQQTLVITLMFAFGHGCTGDPLYPWISRTLRDPRIKDADSRAERLERKALTWLDHVLANSPVPSA